MNRTEILYDLPLFPLNEVLFPQMPLQLRIFEERYLIMITQCLQQNLPFGVVLIEEGSETEGGCKPYKVGCLANIVRRENLENGQMNILAAGDQRFRLLEYHETEHRYLAGCVELVKDIEVTSARLQPLQREVSELFYSYLQMLAERMGEEAPNTMLPEDPALLSYCIAALAIPSLTDKQDLLEAVNPQTRLETERLWLKLQMAGLKQIVPTVLPINLNTKEWQQYCQTARN